MTCCVVCYFFFFFNDTATTEIYTLSLHDALPICSRASYFHKALNGYHGAKLRRIQNVKDFHINYNNMEVLNMLNAKYFIQEGQARRNPRSEEHTSELQSRPHLVCRLLLEKKKKKK